MRCLAGWLTADPDCRTYATVHGLKFARRWVAAGKKKSAHPHPDVMPGCG